MTTEGFLQFLVVHHHISSAQAEIIKNKKDIDILEFLVQQKFFSQKTLSTLLNIFHEEQETQANSSQKTPAEPEILDLLAKMTKKEFSVREKKGDSFSNAETGTLSEAETGARLTITPHDTIGNETALKEEKELISNLFQNLPHQENRYEILETLGEGGMGLVQRVQDHLLGREVALKKIKLGKKDFNLLSKKQQNLLWRLYQEASITAILEHPNIVPLYEMQQKESGELQFTMRKITGITLRSLFSKMKKGLLNYSENQRLSIFLKVCDAIAYAHNQGVIHRDLKPDNIMVGDFGEVYVMDWGIAKRLASKEDFSENSLFALGNSFQTQGGMGTLGYFAPEQQQEAINVTFQSDIFALGKILRECFTFLSPIEEIQSHLKSAEKVNKSYKRSFQNLEKKVPKDIQAIVAKANDQDPKKRYNSVKEFANDIENYLKDAKISVREYGIFELLSKWVKRNKKNITIGISSILITIFCFISYQKNKEKKQLQKDLINLNYWLNVLKSPQPGTQEMALLEINKMQQPEIFQKLIKLMDEGTHYFLSHQARTTKQEEYYTTIVKIVGWIDNPKASTPLYNALLKFERKLSILPPEERSIVDIRYMVALTQALGNLKAAHLFYSIETIRWNMGANGVYWSNTLLISQILTRHILTNQKEIKNELQFYDFKGYAEFNNKQFRKAIPFFDKAIRLTPKNAMAYKRRAYSKIQIKDFPGALKDCEKLIELEPEEGYTLRAMLNNQKNDMNAAIEDYTNALKINPNSTIVLNNRAILFEKFENYKAALQDYNKAIKLNPGVAISYSNRGNLKRKLHRDDEALKDLEYALKLNPKCPEIVVNYSLILRKKNRIKESLAHLNAVIRENSSISSLYLNRGVTYAILENYRNALPDLEEAIRLAPNDSEAYFERAKVNNQLGKPQKAEADYDKALELDPKIWLAYHNRGVLKLNRNDFVGAINDLNNALKMAPNQASSYTTRGIIKLKTKDFKEALKDFEQALSLDPDFYLAHFYKAQLKIEASDFEGAIKIYSSLIQKDPADLLLFLKRGFAFYLKGEYKKAIKDYNKFINKNPDQWMPFIRRGLARWKILELEEAIADFNKVISLKPNETGAYLYRGIALREQGNIEEATESFLLAFQVEFAEPFLLDTCFQNFEICLQQLYQKQKIEKIFHYLQQAKKVFPQKHPKYSQLEKLIKQLEKRVKKK